MFEELGEDFDRQLKIEEEKRKFATKGGVSSFVFSRLSNDQKKAFKDRLNTTPLWANAGVD